MAPPAPSGRTCPKSCPRAGPVCGEQTIYAQAQGLVGDRNPREHEFAVQLRSFDAAKSGASLGVAVLAALASALLARPLKGGLVVVGAINLSGSIEPIHNPVDVVELALQKG